MPFPNLKGRPRSIPAPAVVLSAWERAKSANPKLTKRAFAAQYNITPRHLQRVLKAAKNPGTPTTEPTTFRWSWTRRLEPSIAWATLHADMPELAEVALYARDLSEASRELRLRAVSFPNQRDWGNTIVPRRIQRQLLGSVGARISFASAGKALFLKSRTSHSSAVEFRLGMTGRFHLEPLGTKWRRHCFLVLNFDRLTVYFSDPRRFSRLMEPREAAFALGGFDEEREFWRSKRPRLPDGYLGQPKISWLLGSGDQTGVGNYMANEALGRLGLSPFVACASSVEAERILRKCAEIGAQSYRHGGNSFGSGYFQLAGSEGRYAKFCRFYQNPQVPRLMFRGRPVFSQHTLDS